MGSQLEFIAGMLYEIIIIKVWFNNDKIQLKEVLRHTLELEKYYLT